MSEEITIYYINRMVSKGKKMEFILRKMTKEDDAAVAKLVRDNLEKHGLDIPGTVYFDRELDHLSDFYNSEKCCYFVAEADGEVVGGIGFATFQRMEDTAELQKLYLSDRVKGHRIGYKLIHFIEEQMRDAGFKYSYLETHTNLQAAIHIYEKSGYLEIERPKEVGHSTMNKFFLKKL